eukprot:gnl/Hemi2/8034_TR2767_c0_g1_i1.p2 gnl/Hemi2/8034_TR2767_c0_g1~~gnl/Hemi2/8034_TR2767_c0_g1_i1.p2  ORF type:complete len:160 (+),score=58.06 gnl/Hemi2/8034_TR2767_c0_g1_i1:138-617(+)
MGKDTKVKKKTGPPKPKLVHPNSRKAAALMRDKQRLDNKKQRRLHAAVRKPMVALLWWFRQQLLAMPGEETVLASDEIQRLVDAWHGRHHTDQPPARASFTTDMRAALHGEELELYRSKGIEIPDLTDLANVRRLRAWNGEGKTAGQIAVTRVLPPAAP